jgi:hypothetical protein
MILVVVLQPLLILLETTPARSVIMLGTAKTLVARLKLLQRRKLILPVSMMFMETCGNGYKTDTVNMETVLRLIHFPVVWAPSV